MTVRGRLVELAREHGLPIGRWPAPSSLPFHLRRVIERYGIALVLDVGAHKGEFGAVLRKQVRYRGDIISFEPAETAFGELRRRVAGDPRWRIENIALGDVSGVATLQHYEHSNYNSFNLPSTFGSEEWHLRPGAGEQSRVARLDEVDLPLGRDCVTLLKIDTQGFDLQVLRGAAGCLHQIVALQVEVPMVQLYEGAADLSSMLREIEARGFEVSGFFPVVHDGDLRMIELDCVAVRRPVRRTPG